VLIAVGMTLVAYLVLAFARVTIADVAIHEQKHALEKVVDERKAENARLRARIDYLKSDAAIQLLARQELGWVGPQDTLVVIVPDTP
jgi:cell division protein FtsB